MKQLFALVLGFTFSFSALALQVGDQVDCTNPVNQEVFSVTVLSPLSASVEISNRTGVSGTVSYAKMYVGFNRDDAQNFQVDMYNQARTRVVESLTLSNVLEVNSEADGYLAGQDEALNCVIR